MAVPYTPPPDISKGVAPAHRAPTSSPAVIHTMSVPSQQSVPQPHPLQSTSPDGTTTPAYEDTPLQLDTDFLKTPVGGLLIVITINAFIALITMVSSLGLTIYLGGAYGFFIFVAILAFLHSGVAIFIGLMKFPASHPTVPWPVILLAGFLIVAFLDLIASCLVAARAIYPRDGACAVIGFLLFQLYLLCIAATAPAAIQSLKRASEQQRAAPLRNEISPTEFPPSYQESEDPNLAISTGDMTAQR